jgi:hypothetical protein
VSHVIGEDLVKSHPKDTARIIRDNKQFVTVGPRGDPHNSGERTNRLPPSAMHTVANYPPPLTLQLWMSIPLHTPVLVMCPLMRQCKVRE